MFRRTNSNDHVITNLPAAIRVALQHGSYAGREQLWAPFVFEKKLFSLVVSFDWHDRRRYDLKSFAGIRQTVHPFHTPNGHVIFCRLADEPVEVYPSPTPEFPLEEVSDEEALRDFRERFKKFAYA